MAMLGMWQRLGTPKGIAAWVGVVLTLGLTWLVCTYLGYGAFRVASALVFREEFSIGMLFPREGRQVGQALALSLMQTGVCAAMMANISFYVSIRTPVGVVLAVVFGYALALWLLNCLYHWPLLAAAHGGVIPVEPGERPRLRRVFRNALALFVTAPGYTVGMALGTFVLALLVGLTGIGLVLAVPALLSILATQALHDQMVRLGMIPPPPEGPAPPDEPWRVPQE